MDELSSVMRMEAVILNLLETKPDGMTSVEMANALKISTSNLEQGLKILKDSGAVEPRQVGNTSLWYPLQTNVRKKVLVVEDDPHINKLVQLTIGKGYEIKGVFDGREALKEVREFKPDLIVLDLMLPGVDGLEICQTVKKDPATKDITVVIVSAADAVKNRLAGIKYGADYYIRKPFNPSDLRSLVTIFLKKKGRKFDPLVDLPDEKRLTAEVEDAIKNSESFEINNMRIANLDVYKREAGEEQSRTIIRLVSQLLQDKVHEWSTKLGFVGYIGEGEFIIGGGKNETSGLVSDVADEFERVLPFVYQGSKLDLGVDEIFGGATVSSGSRMSISHDLVPFNKITEKREHLLKKRAPEEPNKDVGAYTYTELQELVGSKNLDLTISRGQHGVSISISKKKEN
ncbi:MAG: response regulator [Candidatus Micrarchaeota archaeon]